MMNSKMLRIYGLFGLGALSFVRAVILPQPGGPFLVGLTISELIDSSRQDPFDPAHGQRALMVSIFHPIHHSSKSQTYLASYLPPATAAFEEAAFTAYGIPNGTLSSLKLQLSSPYSSSQYSYSYSHRSRSLHHPVVIFSPALGTSRLFYNFLAQSIASAGYIVVTIDHPYDADVVEYPNGKLVYFGIDTDNSTQIGLALDTRAEDASFVLNQLSNATVIRKLLPKYHYEAGIDVRKVGMLGHSLGGAAAATTMLKDSRIVAGSNLDGSFWGSVISAGLDRPFLLFEQGGKAQTPDPTWEAIWPHLRGWKLELGLEKAQHYTFSDLPFLVARSGLQNKLPSEVFDGFLGTLDGGRAMKIVGTYVTSFFDFVLKGARAELLEGKSKAFPEVNFVKYT